MNVTSPAVSPARARTQPLGQTIAAPTEFSWSNPQQRNPLIVLCVLTFALLIAYANTLALTSIVWADPLYSHGWIVPVFALGILWLRKQPFQEVSAGERWIGLAVLVAGLGMRIAASFFDMNPVDRISFIVCLAGIFIMVGGMHLFRWAGPAIAFLVFMFPLPNILERTLLWNLQKVATIASTFTLQTLGIAAFRSGNVIQLQDGGIPLNVAEACSGLRMLTIFCALAVGMVFLIDRPWWDKFIILLSAIPIALLANITRIVLTALLYLWAGSENEHVHKFVHDWAGLFMMPIGLGFLWVELQILSRLTVAEEMGQVQPISAPSRGARNAVPIR